MCEVLSQDDIRKIYKLDDRQMAYEQDDLVVAREVSQEVFLEAFREVFLLPLQKSLQEAGSGRAWRHSDFPARGKACQTLYTQQLSARIDRPIGY